MDDMMANINLGQYANEANVKNKKIVHKREASSGEVPEQINFGFTSDEEE